MNNITIKGRLTKDAEVKDTAKGKVVTFTLADNKYRNGKPVLDQDGKQEVQFVDCAAFGKAAEIASDLKKGAFVHGSGVLDVTRVEKDGKYYVNSTVWVNYFHPKKDDAADKAADAEAQA